MGIDPDFPENIVRLTRLEHGQAHYERWLRNKDPRDLSAAQILARGEIGEIDSSGKNAYWYGKKLSEEHKKKMSESHMGKVPWNKDMKFGPHLPERIKKISEAKKGYKHKPESIQKMRESQTGVRISEEIKKKISESLKHTFAKKKADGVIDDRSYMKTEEYRKTQSEAQKLRHAKKKLQQEK